MIFFDLSIATQGIVKVNVVLHDGRQLLTLHSTLR